MDYDRLILVLRMNNYNDNQNLCKLQSHNKNECLYIIRISKL